MDLVVRAEEPAPSKPAWHDPNPSSREGWSAIYEMITTWFCSSHDFNKKDNFIILYEDSLIKLEGQSIRYLGPSLRSAASLVHKAFVTLDASSGEDIQESTPGIFVYPHASDYEFSPPFSRLSLGSSSDDFPNAGTLFAFDREEAKDYYAPGTHFSQGLVWYLQAR